MFYIYLFLPFIAIPQGLSMANMSALISKSVSKEKLGTALGINGSLSALAQGVIPAIAGFVATLSKPSLPFIVGGACIFFAWRYLFLKRVVSLSAL
jgi:sugar phosphate permease